MLFSQDLVVEIFPSCVAARIPYGAILEKLRHAEIDPDHSKALLEQMINDRQLPAALVHPEAAISGGMILDQKVLFPQAEALQCVLGEPARGLQAFEVARDDLAAMGELLRIGTQSDDAAALRELGAELGDELLSVLTSGPSQPPQALWPRATRPGIYRREHATLLIRSATTSLLIDPIGLFVSRRSSQLHDPRDELDAVLISHGHRDHFHPASILAATRPHTQVIVPKVERPNLLNLIDFGELLRDLGQPATEAAWESTISIGDIEIDVLPFFGEQPTRDAPGAEAGLRSWGNCYRFNTPQFSVLVLIDSGTDPMGNMREVAERSMKQRGPVDVVLSCLRSFASPFFGGLPQYWAAVPFFRLRELYRDLLAGRLAETTSGVAGTAEICRVLGASSFAPYAHGFEGVGQAITDSAWGEGGVSEQAYMDGLSAALSIRSEGTRPICWNPGDALVARGRGLVRCGVTEWASS
jgi:L-ascorbate metabolism protein UlaG (beta-lactamase superfamily)